MWLAPSVGDSDGRADETCRLVGEELCYPAATRVRRWKGHLARALFKPTRWPGAEAVRPDQLNARRELWLWLVFRHSGLKPEFNQLSDCFIFG